MRILRFPFHNPSLEYTDIKSVSNLPKNRLHNFCFKIQRKTKLVRHLNPKHKTKLASAITAKLSRKGSDVGAVAINNESCNILREVTPNNLHSLSPIVSD